MLEELRSHRFVGGVGGRSRRAAEMIIVFFGAGAEVQVRLLWRARLHFWKPLSVGVEQDVDFSLSGQKTWPVTHFHQVALGVLRSSQE